MEESGIFREWPSFGGGKFKTVGWHLLVQSHGALCLLRDGVPPGGPVAPVAGPLVLVAPGVPHPNQVHLVPPAPADVHAVQASDGVGVALRNMEYENMDRGSETAFF